MTGNDDELLFGYARVSTSLQELDLQIDALQRIGVPLNQISRATLFRYVKMPAAKSQQTENGETQRSSSQRIINRPL